MHLRTCHASVILLVALLTASTTWATGPDQQRLPWRPTLVGGMYENVNSVVDLRITEGGSVFIGSGSVVCKRHDNATNTDWFGILTADHNVSAATDMRVRFGDNAAVASFGGTHTYGAGSTTNPAWSLQVGSLDMALLAVQINSDPLNGDTRAQFASRIQPLSLIANLNNPRDILNQTITQAGYGLSGTFTADGMDTVASGRNKRFQNNVFDQYIATAPVGAYNYDILRYHFNVPAATGFLVAEGLGYGGDSGSPALYNHLSTQNVPAFGRPDRPNGDVVPDWGGGNMQLLDDIIAGVFVSGNSNDGIGASSPYDTSRGNYIPITAERRVVIENFCAVIPEPASLWLLLIGGLGLLRPCNRD
jgi:hypothetical protein